ncbi:MAG: hypothetical protein ABID45_02045 [Patescibacteria group bacterium]
MKKVLFLSLVICIGLCLALPSLAAPNKITGVKVKKIQSNAAKVIWTADSKAASYIVKVKRKKNGKVVDTVKTTATSTWIKLPKKKKYYRVKVRGVDSSKNKGPWSKAKLFKSKGWRYYFHKKYKFSMKFPKTWKGVKAKKFTTEGGLDQGVYINFKLYSNEMHQWYTLFSIVAFTQDEWVGDDLRYFWGDALAENDDYAFVWMHAQDCAVDLCARARENQDIIDTFKAHN